MMYPRLRQALNSISKETNPSLVPRYIRAYKLHVLIFAGYQDPASTSSPTAKVICRFCENAALNAVKPVRLGRARHDLRLVVILS
jgi:alpha-beta hydrolase superfamily lysophospholipase